ncbi:MAG TPA: hypothetical protein VJZ27_13515, partial [Aggregatilineales bacterium]|nr:hypothetical protein [Aggregatilineales bacterium]
MQLWSGIPLEVFMISDKHLFNGSLFVLIFTGVTVAWGEAIGLTLFISHLGVRALPPGIIIEALLSMIFIFSFEQLKGVVHDAILVVVLCVTGIGLLLFGKELVQIGSDLGFGLYYATQRIMRDVLLLYVWNYVTSYYESHTRYLLSRLMWMTRIGVVIGGLVLVVLSLFFSVRDLVWIWGGALLVCGLSIGVFADEFQSIHHIEDRSVRSSSAVSIRFASALRSFFGSPMMRLASISAFCMMLILSVIYFRAAEVFWDNFSTELSFLRWLAVIGSLFNLLVLPVQYILLPAIARSRYRKTITDIYPIFTGLAFVSVMSVPVLLTASIADFARSSLQISLYDVTQNQMKNTLPGSIRFWAHTFLDGIVEPVGRVVGGVV